MIVEYLKKLPFYDKQWFQFVLFVLRRFEADRCREQAGSLTYTTLFAVVPMLTVFLVIISSIKALEPARQQLQQLIYSNFLPKTTIAFDKALNAFTDKSSNLTVIGILFLFVTTVMMLTSIETVFNRIWRVEGNPWRHCRFYALLDHYLTRPYFTGQCFCHFLNFGFYECAE